MQLIAADGAADLRHELSQTIFQDVESFLHAYNSGMINIRNEQVDDYAKRAAHSFHNVELRNNKFIFLAPAEVALKEVHDELAKWQVVVKLKREINNFNWNNAQDSDVYFFVDENVGYPYAYAGVDDEQVDKYKQIGREKIVTNLSYLQSTFEGTNILRVEDDVVVVRTDDIMNLNDDVLINVRDMLTNDTSNSMY